MEHPCPKCGSAVPDGVPFCKVCRAPQIRVPGFEPGEPVVLPETHGTAEPSAAPSPLPSPSMPPKESAKVQWSQALPWAAIGGVLSLLVAIPLAVLLTGSAVAPLALGFVFMVGGAWSVRLYSRKVKAPLLRPADGAKIGAASGGFAFFFVAVVMAAGVFYGADEMRKAMLDKMTQMIKTSPDPESARQVLDLFKTPEGFEAFVAQAMFVMLLIFLIGASIGGAWYSAWLRKRGG